MEAHSVVAAVGKGGIVVDKGGTVIFAAVACVVAQPAVRQRVNIRIMVLKILIIRYFSVYQFVNRG